MSINIIQLATSIFLVTELCACEVNSKILASITCSENVAFNQKIDGSGWDK